MSRARLLWLPLLLALGLGRVEALDDPLRPPGAIVQQKLAPRAGAAPRPVLTSTLIADGRRLAVINGRQVSVGEAIGDAVVIDIQPAQVQLRRRGRTETLRLLPLEIKQPAGTQSQ